jgi:hypothetical protein
VPFGHRTRRCGRAACLALARLRADDAVHTLGIPAYGARVSPSAGSGHGVREKSPLAKPRHSAYARVGRRPTRECSGEHR